MSKGISILFVLVLCSFLLGELVHILYTEKYYDPLGWINSDAYKAVKEYIDEDHKYIKDVYDCSNISQDMAKRLQKAGFNAKKITVVPVDEMNNYTEAHAIVEVSIWIDNHGRITTPNKEWVLLKDIK